MPERLAVFDERGANTFVALRLVSYFSLTVATCPDSLAGWRG